MIKKKRENNMRCLMNKIFNKESKKGFTLAELLVVVAIVGILVAISVPLFTAQLGKARQATNNANLRAAKVAAVSEYMTVTDGDEKNVITYKYDVEKGTVKQESLDAAYTPEGAQKLVINDAGIETGAPKVSTSKVYSEIYVKVAGDANNDATVTLYAK